MTPAQGSPPRTERQAAAEPATRAGRADAQRGTPAWRRILPPALVLILVAATWDLVVHLAHVQDYIFPSVENVFRSLYKNWSSVLGSATWITFQEMLFGFLISIAVAVIIALSLHSSATLRGAIYPLLIGSQAVPIVVIGPILAIIFGYGITPKLIIVAISCFFPIVVNLVDGLASVDPDLIKVMRTLDGSRLATLFRVEVPSALPSFFSGLRIAAVYAPIGAVFGEYAGSQNGLGYVLIQATPQLNSDLVFAAVLLLTVMSILLFMLLSFLEKICCPWAGKGKK
ncbi:ABC transporter permease [Trebonia kvetii]|uniref:ABC transporter permease n=1 Tax=Trebonia kvetii TaxID=2480626 RepID=UPI001C9E8EF0|nr:ABC transporter permease [Trebonia kvetii]